MDWSHKVHTIAITSNNLKGTFVKELRTASHGLASVITTLVKRTEISESIRELGDANQALRKMVEELKKEVTRLRDDNDEEKDPGQHATAKGDHRGGGYTEHGIDCLWKTCMQTTGTCCTNEVQTVTQTKTGTEQRQQQEDSMRNDSSAKKETR